VEPSSESSKPNPYQEKRQKNCKKKIRLSVDDSYTDFYKKKHTLQFINRSEEEEEEEAFRRHVLARIAATKEAS
jgi:hypothetical protein